ncbi:hypothetical protein [Streptomyces caatingaensis]|uniref:Uncharacterized protein n=1 Tax=Streptomyces caatingaensis TaxID=1678637 RepID=A0A0K9XJN5_9ACTN|nr:hypothetical protein [Streptomyces caatingaensis]KNB53604.1 hypothetical protein AC230_02925 [Streptomyces caatingaensis]
MRRRISAFAVTAALTGGLLLAASPAESVAAGHTVTCNYPKMRQEIASLRAKAARLKHEGEYAAARRTLAKADAISRKLHACESSERNAQHHI